MLFLCCECCFGGFLIGDVVYYFVEFVQCVIVVVQGGDGDVGEEF